MSIFHQKTRNMVRKGLKSNLIIGYEEGFKKFNNLCEIHTQNINIIGGIPKTLKVFDFTLTFSEVRAPKNLEIKVATDVAKIANKIILF